MTDEERDILLEGSVQDEDGKRYATDGERAYCAQGHAPGRVHGYPVGWKEVPERVRRGWLGEGMVKRRSIQRNWEGGEEG
jgi:hypothetical protein